MHVASLDELTMRLWVQPASAALVHVFEPEVSYENPEKRF
jgi:hypothetical protein